MKKDKKGRKHNKWQPVINMDFASLYPSMAQLPEYLLKKQRREETLKELLDDDEENTILPTLSIKGGTEESC